jgi:molecular chaperone HtpG
VQEVRTSIRLRESPSCLVLGEHDKGASMRRIMAAAGQKVPESKPVLEINTNHAIVKYLDSVSDSEQFNELSQLLFDQASLAEGGQLINPAEYVQRLNRLLVRLAGISGTASTDAAS